MGRRRDVLTFEQPRGRDLRWCSVGPGSRPWRPGSCARGAGWGRSKPQRGLGRLHGLVDDRQQLTAEGVEVDLIAQAGRERLDGLGGVVLAAVEAPIHHRLDAAAGRLEQRRHGQGSAGN